MTKTLTHKKLTSTGITHGFFTREDGVRTARIEVREVGVVDFLIWGFFIFDYAVRYNADHPDLQPDVKFDDEQLADFRKFLATTDLPATSDKAVFAAAQIAK